MPVPTRDASDREPAAGHSDDVSFVTADTIGEPVPRARGNAPPVGVPIVDDPTADDEAGLERSDARVKSGHESKRTRKTSSKQSIRAGAAGPAEAGVQRDGLLILHRIASLTELNRSEPTVGKVAEEGLPFGRSKAVAVLNSLVKLGLVRKVAVGKSRLVALTVLGQQTVEADTNNANDEFTRARVSDTSDTSAVEMPVDGGCVRGSGLKGGGSGEGVKVGVEFGGGPSSSGSSVLGGGSPLGVRLRKHRLQYQSVFGFVGSSQELLVALRASGWVEARMVGQTKLVWNKSRDGMGVHVSWPVPKEEGVVEGYVMWVPPDQVGDSLGVVEGRVFEVLKARTVWLEQQVPVWLRGERARMVAGVVPRDEGVFVTRSPKFWVRGVPDRVQCDLFVADERDHSQWRLVQEETAVEGSSVARKFLGDGVGTVESRHLKFDRSRGPELDVLGDRESGASSGAVAQDYLEQQDRLFVQGGYEREQGGHRWGIDVAHARASQMQASMAETSELLRLDLMKRIQDGALAQERVARLEVQVQALAGAVERLTVLAQKLVPSSGGAGYG